MANTLLTPSVIAKEAIMVLQDNMVFSGLVHRDFSNEFAHVGDTVTVRKPASFTASEWDGSQISAQDATEGSVAVKLDKVIDVSFKATSKELALSIQDFSEQFIQPAMRAHAEYLDGLLAGLYVDVPYYQAVSSTPALADWANVGKVLNQNKVPMAGRNMVLDPITHAKYVVLDAIAGAEKSGSTEALRNASIGRVMGLDSYMDQLVKTHTKGTLAASSGDLAISSAAAGATEVAIAATACSGTLVKGDIFTIADVPGTYVVTEDATAASNSITAKIYPALPVKIEAAKKVTLVDGGVNNLAFHKNAFALVTRPLPAPMGAAKAETLSFNGVSVRVVYGYDMNTKADTISLDCLVGVKTLTPELACRLIGAA